MSFYDINQASLRTACRACAPICAVIASGMPRRAAPVSLTDDDYRLLAEFRHQLRRFLVFSEEKAQAIGLSPQQHQALLAIKGSASGAMTIGQLAQRLMIRHNSVVGLINRLVAAGHVVRRADPADMRRATLALTARGEAALEKLTTAHREELRNTAALLKPLLAQLQR